MTLPLILFVVTIALMLVFHLDAFFRSGASRRKSEESTDIVVIASDGRVRSHFVKPLSKVRFDTPKKPVRRSWMVYLITLFVLAIAAYVILSGKYDDSDQKWAFGAVGSLMGFWLR